MTTPPQQPGQGDDPNEATPEADQSPDANQFSEDPAGGGKKKRKTGLIIGIAAAAVIVIGAATGGVLFAKGAFASADSVAKDYVAVATKELHDPRSVTPQDYQPLVCDKAMKEIEKLQKQKEQYLKKAKPQELEEMKKMDNSVANVNENGDKAEATIVQKAPGKPEQKAKMPLIKDGMSWKICTA